MDSCIGDFDCNCSVTTVNDCGDDETSQKLLVSSDNDDHLCQLSSAVTPYVNIGLTVRSRQSSSGIHRHAVASQASSLNRLRQQTNELFNRPTLMIVA